MRRTASTARRDQPRSRRFGNPAACALQNLFEAEVERSCTEDGEYGEGAPSRPIHCGKGQLLARLHDNIDGLPKQRVVCAEAMLAWRNETGHGLSVVENREAGAVQVHVDLPESDVVTRSADHRDRGLFHRSEQCTATDLGPAQGQRDFVRTLHRE